MPQPAEIDRLTELKVLSFLNHAATAVDIDRAVDLPGRDIGLRLGQRILDARARLGRFTSLQQVADIPLIGPTRFRQIVDSLAARPTPVGIDLESYLRESTTLRLRSATAEREAAQLRQRVAQLEAALARREPEIARLRGVIESQASRIQQLSAQLAELQRDRDRVPLASVVRSFSDAIDRASGGFEGRVVTDASAQIRAVLQVDGGEAGIALRAPHLTDPQPLSTVSFTLRPVPPTAAEQQRAGALDRLRAGALDLQGTLDRDLPQPAREPAARLQAVVSELVAADLGPTNVADRVRRLVASADALASGLPRVAGAVGAFGRLVDEAGDPPSAADVDALADALAAISHAVRG